MTDHHKAPPAPRIVEASHFRGSTLLGPVNIIASTKHGDTALLAFADAETVRAGDRLKTKSFLLNAREFEIARAHDRPMKIAGTWYEVFPVLTPPKK